LQGDGDAGQKNDSVYTARDQSRNKSLFRVVKPEDKESNRSFQFAEVDIKKFPTESSDAKNHCKRILQRVKDFIRSRKSVKLKIL